METLIHVENFIDGVHGKSDSYIDSVDPSTGKVFARIADSDGRDAELAIGAAQRAFSSWSKLDVNVRSKILLRIADILESRLEEFARAESRDQGKPLWLARSVEIPRAVQNFRSFATSILHRRDRSTFVESQNALNYTSREPVGVAVLISPWNLPLYLLTFKIAPAIACGNTVVCKPSEFTSLTAFMLCQVLVEAGLPNGVVNMVFGTGPKIGNALVTDPRTRLISFTGSTATAEKIRAASAPFSKRLSLELGGKNAAVIFDDCDLGKCIKTTISSSFLNQGEVCLCTSRIFVQRNIYTTFLEKFLAETRLMKVGDPRQDSNYMGALVSKEHFEKVTRYVNLARSEGLNVACGDEPMNLAPEFSQGYFMRPVVLTGVSDSSRLMQEEIFGPVVCVVEFDEENEVIERVNNSCYGLCATVWSSNINVVHRVAKKLEVGTVWANCWLVRDLHAPFGGVKGSGIGREGIFQSMNFYTEQKNTCIQLG